MLLMMAGIFLIEIIVAWRFPKFFRYDQGTTIGICLALVIVFLIAAILV